MRNQKVFVKTIIFSKNVSKPVGCKSLNHLPNRFGYLLTLEQVKIKANSNNCQQKYALISKSKNIIIPDIIRKYFNMNAKTIKFNLPKKYFL